MEFPKLTFPLTVDFGDDGYWIGDQGPFKYGIATTALLQGEDLVGEADDTQQLIADIEEVLLVFGGHLCPYSMGREVSIKAHVFPEQIPVGCSVSWAFHPVKGRSGGMVERWTFSCLWDFLYIELGKAIQRGNAPRQCRLCGNWFLHIQGERALYCERTAPGETGQTCREIGARAVFEKKIQDEEAWKLYKRAYKKYYARYMKGRMSEDKFKVWAAQAAVERDTTIEQIKNVMDEMMKKQLIERLREALNKE